jgi:hypothetical protein
LRSDLRTWLHVKTMMQTGYTLSRSAKAQARRTTFLLISSANSLISPIKKLVNLIVYVKFFSQKSPENPCGVLILSLVLEYKILRDV